MRLLTDRPTYFGGATLENRAPARSIIVFVVGYALVDLLPVILPERPVFLGLRIGDVADALLIFVLVVLYVELGARAALFRTLLLRAGYIAALFLMVQGHAIHFAANAISGAGQPGEPGWILADFLDEHWGHVELHTAFIILAAMFVGCGRSAWPEPVEPVLTRTERSGLWLAMLAYGVLLAGDAVEGQTVPLMLPCAVVLSLWALHPLVRRHDVSLYRKFFGASFGITAITLVIYGLVFDGFPELTSLASVR